MAAIAAVALPRQGLRGKMQGTVRLAFALLLLAVVCGGCVRVPRHATSGEAFCDVGWYTSGTADGEAALNAVVEAFSAQGMEWGRELRLYGNHGASVSVPCARAGEARGILERLESAGVIRYEPDLGTPSGPAE
jgi:hypothetical protein